MKGVEADTKTLLYRGTDIDGVSIDPDRLEVRGRSITDLIGNVRFSEMTLLVLGDTKTDPVALDHALLDRMEAVDPEHPAALTAHAISAGGAGMPIAAMAGLCATTDADAAPLRTALPSLPKDAEFGLAVTAAVPGVIAAWRAARGKTRPSVAGAGFIQRSCGLNAETADVAACDLKVIEDVMVGWTGGFGPLPPSVMIPRIAIGTGVSVQHAVAAGFAAAGPLHIGATMQAVGVLAAAQSGDGSSTDKDIASLLDHMLASGQMVGGFGHPLLNTDPRPPRIRSRAEELGSVHPIWGVYDKACAHMQAKANLRPNVDFACGAAMIAAGIRDPGTAAGLAMMARSVGMTAHVLERKNRPAFGVRRQTARDHLNSFPTGWL
ncbi:hypothetical protein G5B39_14885 (plasmid) [Rhodobacteraceae bacterium SC52]|nr:hypothetical protein G5B39_14885 [Rhodobacteraceae bacterium SC52]